MLCGAAWCGAVGGAVAVAVAAVVVVAGLCRFAEVCCAGLFAVAVAVAAGGLKGGGRLACGRCGPPLRDPYRGSAATDDMSRRDRERSRAFEGCISGLSPAVVVGVSR